jgi:RNA polymerase sigma-70 factor, ECF subfamily
LSDKVLSGNEFEQLVQSRSRQVLNTAMRVLGDSHLAQDVHQEVFLTIWRRWGCYNGTTHWPGYLYRMTVRKSLELARRKNRLQIANESAEQSVCHDCPDERLRAEELRKKLSACLARLPRRQAEVFILSRLEGLDYEQIAHVVGCSRQTVRVHLHRALMRLSRDLKDFLK